MLIVFVSCVLWLSAVYSFNHGGKRNASWFASYTDSIVSVRGGGRGRGKWCDQNLTIGQTVADKIESDPCTGRYIYMHNLPPEFNDGFLTNCRTLVKWFDMCPYTPNLGFGPELGNSGSLGGGGWFNTNQFFLEVILHNRIKHYECLTNDSSAASATFVPFYAGLEIGRHLWGSNTSVRDSASLRLTRWIAKRPEWKRMQGRDHFLITGRISWDFRRPSENNESDWGNRLLLLPETKNMTVLGIEASPDRRNEFPIPYPTYFHPRSDGEVLGWQERMRTARRRPHLFSFAGRDRPEKPDSVRGEIMEQCRGDSRAKCKLMDCDPRGENKCDDPSSVMELFASSTFCLQPPGDSYTRRSTFDSILAGCIPVFFNEASAYLQYAWHLPEEHAGYSVFIPEGDVKDRKVRIEEVLEGIPEERVVEMREEVIRLIPRVVYAHPSSRLQKLEDAFDIAVKGVLHRVEKLRREDRGT